jgi:membrane protein DedA with SNARE-associated domain
MQLDVLYAVKDQVLLFARTHSDMTVHIVFGLGVAESIALLSFFIPSTILFLAIGGLHQAAGGEFLPIWIAGAAGAFIGDILSYAVGRHFDGHIAAVWPFNRRPHWIENARAFTRRWGVTSVVAGKFLGMLRPLVPVAAGVTHMPAWQFVAASLISALLWAGIFLSPGYGIALLGH